MRVSINGAAQEIWKWSNEIEAKSKQYEIQMELLH